MNRPKEENRNGQMLLLSKSERNTLDEYRILGPVLVCGNPVVRGIFDHGVVMVIILILVWLIGLVAFLILAGSVPRVSKRNLLVGLRALAT